MKTLLTEVATKNIVFFFLTILVRTWASWPMAPKGAQRTRCEGAGGGVYGVSTQLPVKRGG